VGEKRAVDVLVIGSGGAGLRAAIEAAAVGCSTLVLSKGKVNRSGATLLAGANISADVECDGNSLYNMGFPEAGKDDSKDAWFEEIVYQGMFLNNQRLVETYVDAAPDRVRELINWGVKVYGLESERGISVSSRELLDALMQKVGESGVECESDVEAVDLLLTDGHVSGVLGIDVFTGDYVAYAAKAVVLATGGWHSLYPFSAGSTDLTGDGQAMAYRAGAELANMEMVTFCPNTVLTPRRYRGSIMPCILHTYGYGHLLNRKGSQSLHQQLHL
jgi:succinate dehydrogenase/fumarate reductase flavoprotein subunit